MIPMSQNLLVSQFQFMVGVNYYVFKYKLSYFVDGNTT